MKHKTVRAKENEMDTTLNLNSPPPVDMPDVVTLQRFEFKDAGKPIDRWQLAAGERTWTMNAGDTLLSAMLVWLQQNGYAVIPGSNPTQFRRVK
jgi:hypothetical protein